MLEIPFNKRKNECMKLLRHTLSKMGLVIQHQISYYGGNSKEAYWHAGELWAAPRKR